MQTAVIGSAGNTPADSFRLDVLSAEHGDILKSSMVRCLAAIYDNGLVKAEIVRLTNDKFAFVVHEKCWRPVPYAPKHPQFSIKDSLIELLKEIDDYRTTVNLDLIDAELEFLFGTAFLLSAEEFAGFSLRTN
jgi:hypothetical protein